MSAGVWLAFIVGWVVGSLMGGRSVYRQIRAHLIERGLIPKEKQ